MGKAISRTRKTRGRPPTGAESVHLRVLPEQSARIDDWIARQKEPGLTRPEAIRRLVELGLGRSAMATITAAMVKHLHEATGAGMMDCKAALTETAGDMHAAQDWLRKKGLKARAK